MPNPDLLALPTTGFIRLPAVLQYIPVSRSSWWAGVKAGRYPAPVKIASNTTAWRCEDIHQLIDDISSGKSQGVENAIA